ncbi:MAG: hypothetical protein HZB16_13420 [Armatimonadetes bacterium]|nr:hypothetical protein [Armatimonadota bacterium]
MIWQALSRVERSWRRLVDRFLPPVATGRAAGEADSSRLLVSVLLMVCLVLVALIAAWQLERQRSHVSDALMLCLLASFGLALRLVGRGRARLAAALALTSSWAVLCASGVWAFGLTDVALPAMLLPVMIAGLLQHWRAVALLSSLSIAAAWCMAWAQAAGILTPRAALPWPAALDLSGFLVVGTGLILVYGDHLRGQHDRLAAEQLERQRVEAEREALIAQLAASNEALERFAYSVSHDLKSPLVTITGFASRLGTDLSSGRADRAERYLDRISHAAGHMGSLLDELLKLSRAGRVLQTPQPVDLGDVLTELRALLQTRLEAAGMALRVDGYLPVVRGDRQRLLTVFQNLIENATKFTGGQAQPTVTIRCVELDMSVNQATFAVTDNGQGFDPAEGERIFGVFQQLRPQDDGLGIGLALVRRIVEAHAGRIRAESDGVGQGACFLVTLPLPCADEVALS